MYLFTLHQPISAQRFTLQLVMEHIKRMFNIGLFQSQFATFGPSAVNRAFDQLNFGSNCYYTHFLHDKKSHVSPTHQLE